MERSAKQSRRGLRIFNMLGMSALRLTLPYHEERRPPELERADHLVQHKRGPHCSVDAPGRTRHACRGQLAKERGLRTRRYSGVPVLAPALPFSHLHTSRRLMQALSIMYQVYVADVVCTGCLRNTCGKVLAII